MHPETTPRAHRLAPSALLACAALALGCEGTLLGGPAGPDGVPPTRDGDVAVADGGGGGPVPSACDEIPDVTGTPLARLTRREIGFVVRDVFDIDARVGTTLPVDSTDGVYGYIRNTPEIYPDAARGYLDLAADVASRAPLAPLTTCAADDCVGEAVAALGPRLFRRPLFADEEARFVTLYGDARRTLDVDHEGGLRVVLEAMLQTPSFFVRGEEAISSVPGEIALLDGHELAARLAALLWQSVPDAELYDAAARGDLVSAAGIEAQAARMLDDPRADRLFADFHLQWLGLRRPEGDLPLSTSHQELVRSMRREADAFLSHVGRDGTFRDLFAADYSFVDARLATDVYGVTAPAGTAMERVTLPAGRAGVFTLPLYLTSKIEEGPFSPIHLGVNMIRRFMCQDLDNPPEGSLEVNAGLMGTPREISQARNELFCSACHARIDPLGFLSYGFDHFGRPRTLDEGGLPVDTSGVLEVPGAEAREYADIADFAGDLAENDTARACYVGHFMVYALGAAQDRDDAGDPAADACSFEHAHARFRDGGYRIRDLVLGVVTSEAFRHRRASTPTSETCE